MAVLLGIWKAVFAFRCIDIGIWDLFDAPILDRRRFYMMILPCR